MVGGRGALLQVSRQGGQSLAYNPAMTYHTTLARDDLSQYDILECDIRPTALGEALRIRVHRHDMNPMGWRELWEVFSSRYPGKWACQMLPPDNLMIDQANKYHLFIFDKAPVGMNLCEDPPKGTKDPNRS